MAKSHVGACECLPALTARIRVRVNIPSTLALGTPNINNKQYQYNQTTLKDNNNSNKINSYKRGVAFEETERARGYVPP